jgi:hypothetical protein
MLRPITALLLALSLCSARAQLIFSRVASSFPAPGTPSLYYGQVAFTSGGSIYLVSPTDQVTRITNSIASDAFLQSGQLIKTHS